MPWYEELFDERYLDFYSELRERPLATEDAEFVHQALALGPRSRLLDLGCGMGRHAVALARHGYRVTGVDLSEVLLGRARALAQQHKLDVELVRRDMRHIADLGPFAACICLYTVLGYFEDDDNRAVVRAVSQALEPGGLFMLDVTNPLAWHSRWPGERWRETPSGITREKAHYEPITGRLVSERTLFRNDGQRVEVPPSSVRMYAPHEIAAVLAQAGFVVEQLHGGLGGEPFDYKRSLVQVWVARKPAA